jgi:predicted RNA-binding Zn-ribbon protein involved in translation (DUF1610 family)
MDGQPFDETDGGMPCPDCRAVMEWYSAAFICPDCGLLLSFDGDAVRVYRAQRVPFSAARQTAVCASCGSVNTFGLDVPVGWFCCDTCGTENVRNTSDAA